MEKSISKPAGDSRIALHLLDSKSSNPPTHLAESNPNHPNHSSPDSSIVPTTDESPASDHPDGTVEQHYDPLNSTPYYYLYCGILVDSEVLIAGYRLFRYRNGSNRHGGLYVDNQFSVRLDPTPPSPLEFISRSVNIHSTYVFLTGSISSYLQSIDAMHFLNFVISTSMLMMLLIF